jgi:RNA polymerase sigma-70 factor (ECF subfamily)
MEIERKSEEERQLNASYLYRVAYTTLVDELRRQKRRGEVALEEEVETPMDGMTARNDPERAAAASEIGRGIRECLERMLAERRMAVALYLQGHSVPESARHLDWPPKRTENLVYRGLADLRGCLDAKGLRP